MESMFKNTKVFKENFEHRIAQIYGRSVEESHRFERYVVLGEMIRDYSSLLWKQTKEKVAEGKKRQMVYFSMEFLLGRMMKNNLMNLGIYDIAEKGLKEFGISLEELMNIEEDAGLGNGGLGRLAACFMDSLASLGYAGHGNTIRYKYGFFRQKIVDNKQIEIPDSWLSVDNPWEIRKPKHAINVRFFGNVVSRQFGADGRIVFSLENAEVVKAVPYDMPMIGYDGKVINTLRCWSAEPALEALPKHKDFYTYLGECSEISHALYPDDSTEHGKMLRLKQQYFFVCAGIAAQVKDHMRKYKTIHNIHEKLVFQLNDTHPAIAVAEMMRVLLDEFYLEWDEAWKITSSMMCYTNHTILAEALEKWPCHYVQKLLPRIYMIIEEINHRFVRYAYEHGCSDLEVSKMAIIRDGQVHMASLAIVGSYSVNGVAKLHTNILINQEMKEFYKLYPEKFNNKTNGVTHRRYLAYCNPELYQMLTKYCGNDLISHIENLSRLNRYVDDPNVQKEFMMVKKARKEILANYIKQRFDITIDPESIFDTQIKRLHAYKRQLLNCMYIIDLYLKIKNDPNYKPYPQTFIFGAKAAKSYMFAKKVIELINCMAEKINNDPSVNQYIKVVFVENYDVSASEYIIPGSDISEQISLAGKEASGTSNMKFMFNGGITLGTLDGANVEIVDQVGEDNAIIFGLREEEVKRAKMYGQYNAFDYYNNDPRIRNVLETLTNGTWHSNEDEFKIIVDELLYKNDEYLLFADFDSYLKAKEKAVSLFQDKAKWAHMALTNIANAAIFSSDRTISEYANEIWHLEKVN